MKNAIKQTVCTALLALGCSFSAQALTLTLDDMSSTADAGNYGVVLQHSSDTHFVVNTSSFIPAAGSGKLLAYYGLGTEKETLSLLPSLNSVFSLTGLSLAGLLGDGGGQAADNFSIRITGTRVDGTIVGGQEDFRLSPGAFTQYGSTSFSGFTGLKSVSFSGIGVNAARYVGVDNVSLTITPVPEPETYALLLAGLGLIAAVGRRRKAI